ncbi:hypothetical protein IM25_24450 (plasmid) [Rhodococcus sp. p52]|nr:hypothetical protein IM25_24450 [Rhodococcus sp. p52]
MVAGPNAAATVEEPVSRPQPVRVAVPRWNMARIGRVLALATRLATVLGNDLLSVEHRHP